MRIVLVKHAMPEIVPDVPAAEWQLSAAGRAASLRLAEWLRAYPSAAIYASSEPKATETAQIVAERLGVLLHIVAGLHEHERRTMPYFGNKADFEAAVARFFAKPERLMLGEETATQATARFTTAVAEVQRQTNGDCVIVSHGTVVSLYVAQVCGLEPFGFWRRLGLPSLVVVEDGRLVEVVEEIS